MCSLFTFYYGVLSAMAPNYIWLLILRGLVGFGIGGVPQSYVSTRVIVCITSFTTKSLCVVCVCMCVCVCVCVIMFFPIFTVYLCEVCVCVYVNIHMYFWSVY